MFFNQLLKYQSVRFVQAARFHYHHKLKASSNCSGMKVVALISGGKDSSYNMAECVAMGHEIVALANLQPQENGEIDSYMYQTVGSEAIDMYSQAMDLPLFRRTIKGYSKIKEMTYTQDNEDEVEDLFELLQNIKAKINFDGVSCGAVLSDYQRIRVENVCARLNLVSLAYLWRRDQKELLKEMIDSNVEAILIKTAALGLDPKLHLGKTLKEMQEHLLTLEQKYGSHVCGEGGEYETFTLDCPLFKKKIVIDDSEVVMHSNDGVTQVAYLRLNSLHLEDKPVSTGSNQIKVASTAATLHQSRDDNDSAVQTISQPVFEWITDETSSREKEEIPYRLASVTAKGFYSSVGNLICLAGANPSDDEIKACTKSTFIHLLGLLQEQGHAPSDMVYIHLFLSNMSHFGVINSVYKTFFPTNPPARVCISSPFPDSVSNAENKVLFQLDCVSYREKAKNDVKNLHVQGISHWAPANVGPYSQCIMIKDTAFVAGQIGLVPGTMLITERGVREEGKLSIKHVNSIISVMGTNLDINNIMQCVCYVSDSKNVGKAHGIWKSATNGNKALLGRIVYVTVPSLPRAALIEWQTIASAHAQTDSNEQESAGVKTLSALTLFSGASGKLYVSDVALDLFEELRKRLEGLGCKWDDILMIRLFYTKRNISSLDWQDVLQKLTARFGTLPSISCIPVLDISDGNTTSPMAALCLNVAPTQ